MSVVSWMNSMAGKLDVWDIALIKGSCIALGVVVAQLSPAVRRVDPKVLGAVGLGLAVRPMVRALGTDAQRR